MGGHLGLDLTIKMDYEETIMRMQVSVGSVYLLYSGARDTL